MARLVDDLLFLARGDVNELRSTLHQEPINLSDTVAATAEAMRPLATKSNLELTVTTEPGIMVVIHPDHAARLVRILLSNAIAYTPSPGRVSVHVAGVRSAATLRVEDTGIGISSDDLEHVFDRFYRGSSSSRQRPPSHSQPELSGTGLGLPIAKALCSAYGGEIAIESTVGQGTTVTVSLPRVRSLLTEQHPRGVSSLPRPAPASAIRKTPNG